MSAVAGLGLQTEINVGDHRRRTKRNCQNLFDSFDPVSHGIRMQSAMFRCSGHIEMIVEELPQELEELAVFERGEIARCFASSHRVVAPGQEPVADSYVLEFHDRHRCSRCSTPRALCIAYPHGTGFDFGERSTEAAREVIFQVLIPRFDGTAGGRDNTDQLAVDLCDE